MLFAKVQEYAQKLFDQGITPDEIKVLVKNFVGDEDVVDEDGNKVELKKIQLVEKAEEKSEDFELEVKKAVDKAVAETKEKKAPKLFQPEQKLVVPASAKKWGTSKMFSSDETAYRAGQWFAASVYGNQKSAQWCKDHGLSIKTAQQEGTGTNANLGSYLVPDEFSSEIITLQDKYGVFKRNVRTTPMISDVKYVPINGTDNTAYIVAEAGSITASNKTWERATLTAKKLAARVQITNEFNEDALINVADNVAESMARSIAKKIDELGFNGDGSEAHASITGVVNKIEGTAGLVDAAESTWANIAIGDFLNVMSKLPEYADGPTTKWYCHRAFYYTVMAKLESALSGNTIGSYEQGFTPRFLGYPVEFVWCMDSDHANPSANTPAVLFGALDLAALYGDKGEISLMLNPYGNTEFDYDLIQLRAVQRFAITVHSAGTASAAGPVVGLCI